MISWTILITVIGAGLLALSALGSDIGVDFGFEGGGSFITGAIGAFMGIAGASAMITIGLGLPALTVMGVSGIAGLISSSIVVKIISALMKRSSDGNERSISDSIGHSIIAQTTTKANLVGASSMVINGERVAIRFVADTDVSQGDELSIDQYDDRRNLIIVHVLQSAQNQKRQQDAMRQEQVNADTLDAITTDMTQDDQPLQSPQL
jgi:hypothetical protein